VSEPGPGRARQPVVVEDVVASRVRIPADFARLLIVLVALALLLALGLVAPAATSGASSDVARNVRHLPRVVTHLLSFLASLALLVLPLSYLAGLIVRRERRRLIESLSVGLVALAVTFGIGRAISSLPNGALYRSLVVSSASGIATTPLDSYLAAFVAFAFTGGLIRNTHWRPYFIAAVMIYAASALAGSQATLLALAISYLLGMAVGAGSRYAVGASTSWPGGHRIAEVLIERGIPIRRLTYAPDLIEQYRHYNGVTDAGRQLEVHVLDRDLVPSGTLYRLYRVIRVRAEVARGPVLSLERAGELRALLSTAAQDADVPTPELLAGVPCGPDAIVLAYERIDATPMLEADHNLTDGQLISLWQAISRLHARRVTFRGLTPDRMSLDADGQIRLASPTDGTVFASSLRINLERADLLVTTARLVGAQRAAQAARGVIGDGELAAVLPVLQPIALSRQNRAALRRDRSLLGNLSEAIQGGEVATRPPELTDLQRVRPRTVFTLVALIIAGYLLIGQLGSVDLATVFRSVEWGWVIPIIAGSALTYIGAATALTGYVREHLSFPRTFLTQLAASFTGFVTPPAVGGAAVNVRYLQKSGLPATAAGTSVAVCQLVSAACHVVLLVVFAAASGSSAEHSLPIPGWAFIALGVVALAVSVLFTTPRGRRWARARIMPSVREALPRLIDVATHPVKLSEGIGGTLLLNGGYIVALWSSVQAFGGGIPFATVAVVYFAGGAVGSLAPTPGGLGAVEAAMSAGLAAAGMAGASSVSAVLLFRLATFWIPVPIGWLAFSWLQKRGAL
jgi:glycosyltransferase 2 family protein